jgi:hypothetical protein
MVAVRSGSLLAAAGLCVLLVASPAVAQEDPELPPEDPETATVEPEDAADDSLTAGDIADAIDAYIEDDADLKGGAFVLYDPVERQPLALSLVEVRSDELAGIGNDVYFACAAMKSLDGTPYDIDFFVALDQDTTLQIIDIAVHGKAGKLRYAWSQADGVWKRTP